MSEAGKNATLRLPVMNKKDFVLGRLINDKKKNMIGIKSPFFALHKNLASEQKKDIVIFLGANFRDLPGTDFDEVIRLSNECLDYIRKVCKGCILYYKPHPAETDEFKLLNLKDFNFVTERTIAELFFIENIQRIKAVFSTCSGASVTAHRFGLNSYIFVNMFYPFMRPDIAKGYLAYFENLPTSAYIDSFNTALKENKIIPEGDKRLEERCRDLCREKSGNIWFIAGDPSLLADIISQAELFRLIAPERKINLIVVRHHRWDAVPMNLVQRHFDDIRICPRIFYSLRPARLLRAVKTALSIRSFPIKSEDIIVGYGSATFVENCVVSYFKKCAKISVLPKLSVEISYGREAYSRETYRSRLAPYFFNYFLEPMLGLERTRYLEDLTFIGNVLRYRRPINDVYNYVFLL